MFSESGSNRSLFARSNLEPTIGDHRRCFSLDKKFICFEILSSAIWRLSKSHHKSKLCEGCERDGAVPDMCLRLSNVSQVCYSLGNVSKNHSCRQGRSAEALRSHGCSGVKSCSSKNSDINGGCLGEIVLLILRIDFARVSSVSSPLVVMPQFVLQPRSFAESIAPQAGILSSLRFDFNPDIMAPKAQMQICQPQRTSMDRNMLTTYATYAAILIATVYDY